MYKKRLRTSGAQPQIQGSLPVDTSEIIGVAAVRIAVVGVTTAAGRRIAGAVTVRRRRTAVRRTGAAAGVASRRAGALIAVAGGSIVRPIPANAGHGRAAFRDATTVWPVHFAGIQRGRAIRADRNFDRTGGGSAGAAATATLRGHHARSAGRHCQQRHNSKELFHLSFLIRRL